MAKTNGVSIKSKEVMAEIPITFRVTDSIHEMIEDEMIKRREFNKSKIHREIFMLGLEQFKQQSHQ